MRRTEGEGESYKQRLEHFLKQIEELSSTKTVRCPLHDIMDTVPFRDLETALMMARMEQGAKYTSRTG